MPATSTIAPIAPIAPVAPHIDLVVGEPARTIPGLAGHVSLHYQPQLDLLSGAILSAEALLRWWHPRFGLLSPYASLAGTQWAAEISSLEGWSAAEACEQGVRWSGEGLPIQVALNVSTAHLLRPGFVASLGAELDRTGLGPQLLSIDVPFAAFASDGRATQRVVASLTAARIGVAVDGVPGGVRLDGLADLGAEAWKVELRPSAFRRTQLHPSIPMVVDQAHQAGAIAVAKAVEDDAQLAAVRGAGFDAVFGHVISPPLPGSAAREAFRPEPRRLPPLFGPSTARAS